MTLIIDRAIFAYAETQFNFSLTLEPNDSLGVVGASGAGKSTLLNLIAGFLIPTSGSIEIDGVDVTHLAPGKRSVAMLFQENNLFPHLTVFDNIALGIRGSIKLHGEDKQTIERAAEKVAMANYLGRYPGDLSGGQRQRVALARTLVRKRSVFLLDEPFSSLDAQARVEMLELVRAAHQEQQFVLIMVSHALEECRSLCSKVATVAGGRIITIEDARLR
jgi:thiamine transport system ATP-binding protein